MKKLVSSIRDITFLMIIVVACFFIIEITYNQSPSIFGYRVLRVISFSMRPTISKGDCILIKKVNPDQLQVGDIITFRSEDNRIKGLYNTHRIKEITVDKMGKRTFTTKGDNNVDADTLTVSSKQIAGRYEKTLLGGRTLNSFIEFILKKWNYFALIIAPLLICVVSCIIELIKEIRKNVKELKEVERSNGNEKTNQS